MSIVIFSSAVVLHADSAEEFRQGILASDRKEWSEVVKRMQAAIAERPSESRDRMFIYGVHYEPYLPHLWLGLAYSNLQQCDAALRELNESEKQGEVTKTSRYRDLQIASYQCGKKVAVRQTEPAVPKPSDETVTAAARSVQEQIDAATRVAQQATELRNADPSIGERLTRATANLNAGQRRLDAGKSAKNLVEIGAAADMASIAHTDLDLLLRDAKRFAANADDQRQKASVQQLQTQTMQRLGDARIAVVLASREKPRPPLKSAIAALQQEIDRARNASQVTSPDMLRQMIASLETQTARVQKLGAASATAKPSWPPSPLFEAAVSFFNGDYRRTLAVLDRAKFDDTASAAQALLFRSAAHYSQYTLGGGRDSSLRGTALQEIRKCRSTDPRIAPTVADFSPRFVQFFAATR